MSYVVNVGFRKNGIARSWPDEWHDGLFWDREDGISAEELQMSRFTGVFWNRTTDGFRRTFDAISNADGLSQTLLLSENSTNTKPRHWSRPAAECPVCEQRSTEAFVPLGFAIEHVRNGNPQTNPPGTPKPSGGAYWTMGKPGAPMWVAERPGQVLPILLKATTLEPSFSRNAIPSSEHPGVIHFAFCDGRALPISRNLDQRVYIRLMTSGGTLFGEQAVGDGDF